MISELQYSTRLGAKARPLVRYILFLLLVLLAGYLSRAYVRYLPIVIRKRTGDALWATAVFAGLTIIRPRWSTMKAAVWALSISVLVEFSQKYHAPWIDHIRRYPLGGMILGYSFYWLDMVAYVVGVLVGMTVDLLIQ